MVNSYQENLILFKKLVLLLVQLGFFILPKTFIDGLLTFCTCITVWPAYLMVYIIMFHSIASDLVEISLNLNNVFKICSLHGHNHIFGFCCGFHKSFDQCCSSISVQL